jgi:hypothetical protein
MQREFKKYSVDQITDNNEIFCVKSLSSLNWNLNKTFNKKMILIKNKKRENIVD